MRFCIGANAVNLPRMKKRYLFSLIILVGLAVTFFSLRTPDTDPMEMLAKYGGPQSKFAAGPGGMKIHFRDQGNPDGTPIILVHGTSASLHAWEPLVERLGGEFRLITYDQPGHGLTGEEPDNDYSARGMMRALDAVAEAAGVDHFVLGGNSMGGWVSWRYALAYERVDALILLDAAGAPLREGEEPPPLNLGFKLARSAPGRFLLRHFMPRDLIETSIRQTVLDQSLVTDAYIDRYWELLRLPANRNAAPYLFTTDREPEMAAHLSEITAPTLIIWGAEDQLIYATAAHTFNERIDNSEVRIYESVGHLPMEEAPDKTASDIRRFLESLAPEVENQLELEPVQ